MTRSVVVCSASCGESAQARRALDLAFAAAHLPLAVAGGGDLHEDSGEEAGQGVAGAAGGGGAGFRWAESDLWRQVRLL